ncbi:GIY-YIG nuclease family protein [Streptomyces sp. NPDC057557]|uniref:GIY-YIG nuclease family protein n=1 Tax=Streptomyces sp. NPDC057557 TaxID=3346167 RepID=UPI0036AC7140
MSPDGRGGRGAYRCGCGARIVIRDAPAMGVSCSAQGCRTASVTGTKIRLCADHKDEITMVLAQDVARTDIKNLVGLQEQGAGRWKAPTIPVYRGVEVAPTDAAIVRELPPSGQHDPIVYFLLNGDRVKIGYTTNLLVRITALSLRRENVILALDGGRDLEARLHRRFREHRIRSTEWFNFGKEIQEYARARPRVLRPGSGSTCETP